MQNAPAIFKQLWNRYRAVRRWHYFLSFIGGNEAEDDRNAKASAAIRMAWSGPVEELDTILGDVLQMQRRTLPDDPEQAAELLRQANDLLRKVEWIAAEIGGYVIPKEPLPLGSAAKGPRLICPEHALASLRGPTRPLLIDVRTESEHTQERIPGSILLTLAEFREGIRAIDPEQPLLVYCKSGQRSRRAAEIANEEDFGDVMSLDGGIDAWKAAGLPTSQGDSPKT